MDQQTTTLFAQVITGAVALVAGLGAASLTAYMTVATLTTRWLPLVGHPRNNGTELRSTNVTPGCASRQQETYADFPALVNSTLKLPGWGAPTRAVEPNYIQVNAALNRVALVGSPDAVEFANAFSLCAMKLAHIERRREMELPNNPSGVRALREEAMENMDAYHKLVKHFVKTIRKDIGAPRMSESPEEKTA